MCWSSEADTKHGCPDASETLTESAAPNNQWAELSTKIVENADAAKIYDDSKEALRKLIDDDWSEAYGHGITAKRDKRGRVIIRPTKEK